MAGPTIVIVEDDPDDQVLCSHALKEAAPDCAVELAADGPEALRRLKALADEGRPPALVLLDLKLPGLDGFEVLRRIRDDGRLRLLPVVLLTGSAEECDVRRGYELGANGYLRKEVDFAGQRKALQSTARYWLDFNVPPPAPALPPA